MSWNNYTNSTKYYFLYLVAIVLMLSGCNVGGGSSSTPPAAKPSSISVSPTNVSIAVGYNANLSATETYADGTTANVTSQVIWTSAASGVVSVGANTGLLTGASAGGPVVVTATLNGLTSAANVSVSATGGVSGTSLAVARNDHTASLLANGKVLVVGGYGNSSATNTTLNALDSVEMYDPSTALWLTVTHLITARGDQTSVTLQNGQVLVTGGTGSDSIQLTSSELYDPTAGSWTSACNLINGRSYNTITLLQSGIVLVAGGDTLTGTTNTAEVYDPTVTATPCSWTQVASMSVPRNTPTATLLNDGRVLVTGGFNVYFNVNPLGILSVFTSSELYDPVGNTWTPTGNLTGGRYQHTATLLNNGKVLVVGGYNAGTPPIATAELYDPSTGLWTPTGSLATARAIHTANLLPNGKVLVMGGLDASGNPLTSTELYDPATGVWTTTTSLVTARDNSTSTLIPYSASTPQYPNGSVLAAGGDGATNIISSSELYWW